MWIGARRDGTDSNSGQFVWMSSHKPVVFNVWNIKQLDDDDSNNNNSNGGNEVCAEVTRIGLLILLCSL